MISTPNLRRYRNSEFIAFFNDVIRLVQEVNIAALATPLSGLQNVYNDLDTSFQVSQGNLMTNTIQTLDARRDAAIKGIRGVAKSYQNHFETASTDAAALILQAIDKYGRQISELNYQAQTASMKGLIKDIENDADLTTALTTLNLTTWFTEMKIANEAFEQKYLERVTDNAAKKVVPVSKHRPIAVQEYETLVKYIEANEVLNPSEELTTLKKSLEELINKYNAL